MSTTEHRYIWLQIICRVYYQYTKVTHSELPEKPIKLIYCWSPILQ